MSIDWEDLFNYSEKVSREKNKQYSLNYSLPNKVEYIEPKEITLYLKKVIVGENYFSNSTTIEIFMLKCLSENKYMFNFLDKSSSNIEIIPFSENIQYTDCIYMDTMENIDELDLSILYSGSVEMSIYKHSATNENKLLSSKKHVLENSLYAWFNNNRNNKEIIKTYCEYSYLFKSIKYRKLADYFLILPDYTNITEIILESESPIYVNNSIVNTNTLWKP